MHVRLTHIDGKLPNLALMKIAHHHRTRGDRITLTKDVRRALSEPEYDRVYRPMSIPTTHVRFLWCFGALDTANGFLGTQQVLAEHHFDDKWADLTHRTPPTPGSRLLKSWSHHQRPRKIIFSLNNPVDTPPPAQPARHSSICALISAANAAHFSMGWRLANAPSSANSARMAKNTIHCDHRHVIAGDVIFCMRSYADVTGTS